jgi:predicted restriction endonuclease
MKRECLICGDPDVDTAHIKTRGSRGGDEAENLMDLCRLHHTEQHKIGIVTFTEKYKMVRDRLEGHGWAIVDLFGQKKLRRDT